MASDLFLITPLAFLIPLAPANDRLTYHKPVSSLLSFNILFSMGMQTLCVAFFQIGAHFITKYVFPSPTFDFFLKCNANFDEYENIDDMMKNGPPYPWTDYPENEEDDTYYMECIYNSTNFYISFAQYLILAVVFCTGKPFKKNIFYNYGMLIFSIIGFIYSEYIVFYVDKFSWNLIKITPYPDDHLSYFYDELDNSYKEDHSYQFKYIIMIIIVVNFFFCLIIEKVIVFYCSKAWRKRRMNDNRRKLEADINKEATLYLVNDVKNFIKEQKAYDKIFS
jgi:hypothetical protein